MFSPLNYIEQVVVSGDGKIIGFQPTNRVAVNNWAANPLAKELYGGKRLTPGIISVSPNSCYMYIYLLCNLIKFMQLCCRPARTRSEDEQSKWHGSIGAVDIVESEIQFCNG